MPFAVTEVTFTIGSYKIIIARDLRKSRGLRGAGLSRIIGCIYWARVTED